MFIVPSGTVIIFFFICRILACMCCLLVLPFYIVNKDEYMR